MRPVRKPIEITPLRGGDAPAPLLSPRPGFAPAPWPWQSIHVLPDGETLEISGVHGNGGQLHALDVEESDQAVLVTMWLAFTDPPTPQPRTAEGYPFRARVRLERPLDGRPALDGALGTEDEVREQEIETAVRWRTEMGLPTDRQLVAELVDLARMPDGRLYGQEVMSDDEQRWYQQSLDDKEAAADFAKSWLAEQTEDLDSHAEITWHDGGDFVQYVSGRAAQLRAAAAAAGVRRLRVEQVSYTYRQLDKVHTQVRERLTNAGFQIVRSGPDVRANAVSFSVAGGDTEVDRARRVAAQVAPPDAFAIAAIG